jgi:hypothetical protein
MRISRYLARVSLLPRVFYYAEAHPLSPELLGFI